MYGKKVKLRFLFLFLILVSCNLSVFLILQSLEENVSLFSITFRNSKIKQK